MTLFLHELKINKLSLIIWTAALSFMLGICILIYPEMAGQMTEMTDMFADMGAFTDAFGMDKINFGEFGGYFVVECGNVLGLGGAIFAAILGISALYKEEKSKTAEFLLTQPIARKRIVTEKLLSVLAQIFIMNFSVIAVTLLCMLAIGEGIAPAVFVLLFLAYLLMQLEIAILTFSVSAFIRRGGLGIGIGMAFAFYFIGILSNITDAVRFLKYLTPFGYVDGAGILSDTSIEVKYLIPGVIVAGVLLYFAYKKYEKKDILT